MVDNDDYTYHQNITQDETLDTFREGIQRYHRDSIRKATDTSTTKESILAAIQKLQTKIDRSKTVPRVYDAMQQSICYKYPDLDLVPSYFSDRMKQSKEFDRAGYYKEEGNTLLASVKYFFEHIYGWESETAIGRDGSTEQREHLLWSSNMNMPTTSLLKRALSQT